MLDIWRKKVYRCWVIVLDTEGLGGLEADAHYDTRIFSLATLSGAASSLFRWKIPR